MKKVLIIGFILVFILSSFFVSANHREDIKDERFYFNKLFNNLWGKITGNPIFQRISKVGSVESASIKESPPENSFRRGLPFKTQSARTDSTSQESIQIQPAESNQKSKEIKKLTSNLLELNNKYLSPIKSREKKNILSELEKSAIEREKEMIELAKQNPILFLNNIISKEERNLFPDKIKEYIEQETIIEGDLITLHLDDFVNQKSSFEYFIITEDNKKINFYPINSLGFISGVKIKVSGFKIDNNIVGFVKEIEIKKEKTPKTITGKAIKYPPPTIPPMPEERRIAVILVNFLDSPPSPFTPAEAHELIFNGQFQNFYREQSYNKMYFSGDVFGWYTLPINSINNCAVNVGWGGELDPYISNNINLSNYEHLLLLNNVGSGCWLGGGSTVGKGLVSIESQIYNISVTRVIGNKNNLLYPSDWSGSYPPNFSWTNLDFLLTHEIGHSLGVVHANGYDCGSQSLDVITNCQHLEYGNYFDAMGAGTGFAFHFNAFYKEKLGWVLPQEELSINQSGIYTINDFEMPGGKKFAKIKLLGSDLFPYYLEYRKGIGFDSSLNYPVLISNQDGLLVNNIRYSIYPYLYDFPRILDMNATPLLWENDLKSASLSGNNVFNDPQTGIAIGPIISSTPTSITFNVNLQQTNCTREQPLIKDVELYGDKHLFTIFNADYPISICGPSEFRALAELPLGFFTDDFPINSEIFPLNEENFVADIQTSPTLCTGTYPITFSVENLNSGLITTETIYVNIAGTTPCLPEVAPPEF